MFFFNSVMIYVWFTALTADDDVDIDDDDDNIDGDDDHDDNDIGDDDDFWGGTPTYSGQRSQGITLLCR